MHTLEELNEQVVKNVNEKIEELEKFRDKIKELEADILGYETQIKEHKVSGKYKEQELIKEAALADLKKRIKEKASSYVSFSTIDVEGETKTIESNFTKRLALIEREDQTLLQLNFNLGEKQKFLGKATQDHLKKLGEIHKALLEFHKARLNILLKSGDFEENDLKPLISEAETLLRRFPNELEGQSSSSSSSSAQMSAEEITQRTIHFIKEVIALSEKERTMLGEGTIGRVLLQVDEKRAFASPMGKTPKVQASYYREKLAASQFQAMVSEQEMREQLKAKSDDLAALQKARETDAHTISALKETNASSALVISKMQQDIGEDRQQIRLLEDKLTHVIAQFQLVIYKQQDGAAAAAAASSLETSVVLKQPLLLSGGVSPPPALGSSLMTDTVRVDGSLNPVVQGAAAASLYSSKK